MISIDRKTNLHLVHVSSKGEERSVPEGCRSDLCGHECRSQEPRRRLAAGQSPEDSNNWYKTLLHSAVRHIILVKTIIKESSGHFNTSIN